MLRRRTTVSWIRIVVCVFFLTFLWLQLNVFNLSGSGSNYSHNGNAENYSNAFILSMVPSVLHKFLISKPSNNLNHTFITNRDVNGSSGGQYYNLNISEIKKNIAHYNDMQIVYNEDLFGPLQNDSVIIVIQVHTRTTYLRHLIVSLAQVRGIERALIVFSHDYFNLEINDLVQSIDFCKVMQIFYPYSIQTHPHEFPGEDPKDCPRDMKQEQALLLKCKNALYPDLYGHYREAKFTQTKHHWWWKANRVFNQLEITRYHTGMVVFLEEDHYVAADFIHVLNLMEKTGRTRCPKCNIISLGTYLKTYNYYGDAKKKEALRAVKQHQITNGASIPPSWSYQVLPSIYQHYQKVEITPWVSSKHNMGMALNRTTWQQIAKCASYFCKYDDYNWDWSLQHISQSCLPSKLHAMVVRGPRVFHIGECGVHHKKKNCESTAVISKVQQVLKAASRHLFPDHLVLTFTTNTKKSKLRKGNGGWGDKRDHMLCMNMTLEGR